MGWTSRLGLQPSPIVITTRCLTLTTTIIIVLDAVVNLLTPIVSSGHCCWPHFCDPALFANPESQYAGTSTSSVAMASLYTAAFPELFMG